MSSIVGVGDKKRHERRGQDSRDELIGVGGLIEDVASVVGVSDNKRRKRHGQDARDELIGVGCRGSKHRRDGRHRINRADHTSVSAVQHLPNNAAISVLKNRRRRARGREPRGGGRQAREQFSGFIECEGRRQRNHRQRNHRQRNHWQ